MAKSEMYGNSLIPLVLVAGILSGGLWRGNTPAETAKAGESGSPSTNDKSDGTHAPLHWISDLRPALESLDGALGAHADSVGESPLSESTTVALAAKGAVRDQEVLQALASLHTGLNDLSTGADAATCDGAALEEPARVLGAWMLADDWDGDTPRAAEAKALLDEYRAWRLFAALAKRVRTLNVDGHLMYSVRFIIATIPDYVDSNSGWLADQGLAGLQSGMAQTGYLFDRVKLIDWSRASGGLATVVSTSRLHERQPGIVIFRYVKQKNDLVERKVSLEVVLTVLETPTAGVHQVALRNSLQFLRAWNACSEATNAPLRVLGPSFSGSTASLAMVLGEAPFETSFSNRVVITGSATADENVVQMAMFSPGTLFKATVQPTSVLTAMMANYLRSINPRWTGKHVALLNESNTAYGRSAKAASSSDLDSARTDVPFADARIFNFPLHIAQLRSDAPSLEQAGAALMSGPVIPLNLRESAPPSDVIPALRPQLTSPIVESTVDSILDAIRHEKISAVGIFATDDRDVLFLAREVKRAAPDVQLFLFGTHALYLHPDYLPYVRGALVASSYALTLANQPEIPNPAEVSRQPFQSMVSEGVFYATRALVSLQNADERADPLPYCGPEVMVPADVTLPCIPVAPASINVIGEDGYWTLLGAKIPGARNAQARATGKAAGDVPLPSSLNVAPLPPLPLQFSLVAALVLVTVAAHVWVMLRIDKLRQRFDDPSADQSFFEWPLVRVLIPPRTFDRAARRHRIAASVCFVLLSLAAAWVVAIGLPFLIPEKAGRWTALLVAFPTCIAVIYTGITCYGPRRRLPPLVEITGALRNPGESRLRAIVLKLRRLTMAEGIAWLLFGGMVVTMVLFLVLVGETAWTADDPRLTLARMVGGGIVSPAAMTLFLATAFYTAVFTGVRRLSLVGFGYGRLGRRSAAFSLLTAEREQRVGEPKQGSLAGMLDMPMENMPAVYPAALLVILLIAAINTTGVTTIEARALSWFVKVGTWTTLGLGLLQLAQALALWHSARSHLKRLAQTPIEKHLQEIAPAVPWDISLVPPRLTELMPVAHLADDVIRDFRRLALPGSYGAVESRMQRDLERITEVTSEEATRIGLRPADLTSRDPLFAEPLHVEALETEMRLREHAAVIQSDSWLALWRLSDSLVTMLQSSVWLRSTASAPAPAVRSEVSVLTPPKRVAPMTSDVADVFLEDIELPHPNRSTNVPTAEWFAQCERLVALQMAFVLRDIVARTITSLFAAMLCLISLTTAHLFYVFSGRASLLTIDMLAIGATALAAVWILVDMERDHVLSRLRTTTPGRVDINWEFIKRIVVYGVLPLLAVIAALFPEVGGTLFGWLEPLRKLSSL